MGILGICPRFDGPTQHSSQWFHDVLGEYEIIELNKERANPQETEKAIQEQDPESIVFYDHGSEDVLWAQGGREHIFDLENAQLMKGRSLYTLACRSAKELLPKMVQEGALATWGYDRDFGFYTGDYEKYFEEQANRGLKALLKAKTFGGAKQVFLEKCEEMIEELEERGDIFVADQLIWNMEGLRVLGDQDTKIPIPKRRKPTCPVSRVITYLFGYRTLDFLRSIREKI